MVEPKLLCRKHLLGEHVEHHMFLGTLKKNISVGGYLRDGLLDILSLKTRHDALVAEMISRGYRHHSATETTNEQLIAYAEQWKHIPSCINVETNLAELCRRCPDCKSRIEAQRNNSVDGSQSISTANAN